VRSVPSAKHSFLRYHLDIWPETSERGWVTVSDLEKPGNSYISESEKNLSPAQRIQNAERRLAKRDCYLGLDLALKNDLSALACVFPPVQPEGVYEVLFKVWCPEENIVRRSKEHRVPYVAWRDGGFITTTPGEVTDYSFIRRDILELRSKFRCVEMGFDCHLAEDLALQLRDAGMTVTQVTQGFNLSPSIQRVESLISTGRLCLHGNPVAKWNFSNATLGFGVKDVRFDKAKSREKIDCAVSCCVAFERLTTAPPKPKIRIRLI
jgi:phage terminase large subunit-like protein